MIDLDEFERRLRPPAEAPQSHEDPLTELARLVGGHEDPFKTVFEQDQNLPRPIREKAPIIPVHSRTPVEPHFEENYAAEDFAKETPQFHGTIDPQNYAHEAVTMTAQPEDKDYNWPGQEEAPVPPPRMAAEGPRSRRPLFVMGAIIAAGIMGIGVSFAYKSKSGPHDIATIKAMAGPTKIQPDSPGGVDMPNQDASILNKNQQPTPTKLADHRELPVDLAAQSTTPPRVVMADAGSTAGTASNAAAPAAGSPDFPSAAPQDIQSYGIGALIEPKKVKTVSVRSDGTLLPNDTPPQMPQSAQSATQAPPAAPPTAGTTPKSAAAKSTARVVTTPKPPQSIDQLAADTPMTPPAAVPAKPKAVPAKPVKLAEAAPADTAQTAPEAAAPGEGGGFAVQFSAPGSEQEAHEITAKLMQKFGADLSGHHLTYHRAKVGDKTVYRVRTAGLPREEATGICEKVKSDGGSCFIAKN
jgi:hypothetical protein